METEKRLRVLVIHNDGLGDLPSGEISVIRQESRYLKELGVDVRELIYKPSLRTGYGKILSYLKLAVNMIWSFEAYGIVKRLIGDFKPDVVHFHSIMPFLSLSVLAATKRAGIPTVQSLHNVRWVCIEGGYYRDGKYCDLCANGRGWQGIVHGCARGRIPSTILYLSNAIGVSGKWMVSRIDKFLAVSSFIATQHINIGIPESKIQIKHNGIELSEPRSIDSAHSAVERAGIAYVGRISIAKGSEVLKALARSVQVPIHIVGSGDEQAGLEEFCHKNHLTHVKFWGRVDHTAALEILATVKLSIVPSQCGESFSLVAAESMSVGTPVIASDLGGLSGLVSSAQGGIVVKARDYLGFTSAVQTLLNDEEKLSILANSGRDYVRQNLQAREKAKELLSVYSSLASRDG